jgi:hypothetical protein
LPVAAPGWERGFKVERAEAPPGLAFAVNARVLVGGRGAIGARTGLRLTPILRTLFKVMPNRLLGERTSRIAISFHSSNWKSFGP